MKISSLLLTPAVCLVLLLTPTRAEEPAPAVPQLPPEFQTLLMELVKQASSSNANAAPTDSQSKELQSLLLAVLKNLTEMLPQLMEGMDVGTLSTATTANASSTANAASSGSAPKATDASGATPLTTSSLNAPAEKGLRTGGLNTGGLNPGGSSSNLSDEDWRRQFQKRQPSR